MRYGYFDNEHKEYVIDRIDLPTSWTNYLGVEDMCTVINHTAGGYTFYKSPEYHRITRFRGNAVPMDRPGHYIYLRDSADGDYWSVSWQPVGKPLDGENAAKYVCRHGLSYSIYECDYKGIHASEKLFIPRGEAVELWDVSITNTSDITRRLDVFSYCEFSYHSVMIDNQNFQMSLYCAGSSYEDGIIEHDLFYEPDGYQFFTSNFTPDGFDCLRDTFLGLYHTEDNPVAVINGHCSGSFEKGNNHCGVLQKSLELRPGQSMRLIYMFGEGNRAEGRRIREKYSDPAAADAACADLAQYWQAKADRLKISTPNEGMNTLINIWNLYQSEINVMFSRFASFIEVGGRTGLGYRDTAQDAMTIPHSNPDKCRQRIVELMRGLTSSGYGIHLFDPAWFEPDFKEDDFSSPTVIPKGEGLNHVHGLKDACSDDALWLVPSVTQYVKETGDFGFVDRIESYADGGNGSIYEHLKKILDFSAEQVGATGICKGLRADWNDCLNLGGGESAMVSFLHYWALENFIELARFLGRSDDADRYLAMAEKVRKVTNDVLWDGEWFLRGFTKNGRKIGTHTDSEGRVHLESNAWAVLSGAAAAEHAGKALDSIHDYLATPYGIMLNAPSYTKEDMDIGFITRVYPGLKENGSIFSHPNPWVWAAECRIGRGDRAMEYYNSLCPYNQNDMIEIRQAEPYSYCQFISGRDHSTFGRAHHPFMTGSGGWAYFAVTEYMLGIRPGYDELVVDPCIPSDWTGFKVTRNFRGAIYDIQVLNAEGSMKGVRQIYVDGERASRIPVFAAGSRHTVTVEM